MNCQVKGRESEQGEESRRYKASDHHNGERSLDLRSVQSKNE
jgi:hypothetical protein